MQPSPPNDSKECCGCWGASGLGIANWSKNASHSCNAQLAHDAFGLKRAPSETLNKDRSCGSCVLRKSELANSFYDSSAQPHKVRPQHISFVGKNEVFVDATNFFDRSQRPCGHRETQRLLKNSAVELFPVDVRSPSSTCFVLCVTYLVSKTNVSTLVQTPESSQHSQRR